ncbi:MAG TPA: hypothetical protein VJI74_03310 [Candidatus Paceibacterota bacterium]
MKLGKNFAIFVLFFGAALVEAIQSGNVLLAAIFIALGILFLVGEKKEPTE